MSKKPDFITGHSLPKGSVWRVCNEVVGGTRLEELHFSGEKSAKVSLSAEAFETLKSLRARGETVRGVLERLIFEAVDRPKA